MNCSLDSAAVSRTFDAIATSSLYRDYQKAFVQATGLPLFLLPAEGLPAPSAIADLAVNGAENAIHVCPTCEAELHGNEITEPVTAICALGVKATAIPVRSGERLIAFLRTGKVLDRATIRIQFRLGEPMTSHCGILRGPSAHSGHQRYCGSVRLLTIFAHHLARLSNEMVIHRETTQPLLVMRAKDYIEQHESEDISLPQVARAVNTTPSYLCRLFKQSTGLNYTDYLRRLRLGRAQKLLLNPQMRVSEVAFAAGFQSLTQFNRTFQRIMGQSPTEFRNRARLPE